MTLVLDNGGYTIKHGISTPTLSYNCLARVKRTLELAPESIIGHKEIYRPIERGILVDLTLQTKIWELILSSYKGVNSMVMGIPAYMPSSVKQSMYEVIFESLDIPRFAAATLGCKGNGICVDFGFSGCTVTPYYMGYPLNYATKRISIGGKLLTNFLKEQISFRQFDMREETWLVNDIKEKCCRISSSFLQELDGLNNMRYELPDFESVGKVLAPEEAGNQVLNLGNLEISVPEILFHPSDVGLDEAGIPEVIAQAMEEVEPTIRPDLLANIQVTGGSSQFPGLLKRLRRDIR